MIDVVALGELLIDFAAKSADAGGYPTMAANPGGAPGNFLAGAGRLRVQDRIIGKVGADTFGRLLRRTMQHAGIETKGIVEDPRGLHDPRPSLPLTPPATARSPSRASPAQTRSFAGTR